MSIASEASSGDGGFGRKGTGLSSRALAAPDGSLRHSFHEVPETFPGIAYPEFRTVLPAPFEEITSHKSGYGRD